MRKKIFFFLSFLFITLFFSKVYAYNINPKDFIQTIVDDAKQILVATNTKEYKSIKLIEIAKEKVDIQGIGNYSIGKYRKQLNEDQKNEYNALFEKYFLKSFTSRLSDYSDPKIKVISSEVINKNYTIVSSILEATTQKPEVKINWRVYTKDPENLKIRDLIIEGISHARTQKEEFSSIIDSNSGNINSLFSKLEEFINN